MSLAGIHSNRGDNYQALVAFDWTLSILSGDNYHSLEVDSAALDSGNSQISVDDVVIGCADGTLIACQCKKNQQHFKDWSVSDLGDELTKAAKFLANNPNSRVRFYSRSSFGALAKLREHAQTQPDEAAYRQSLSHEHQKTEQALAGYLQGKGISTFEWLRRTTFELSHEFDREKERLKERLAYIVSNVDIGYDVLWTKLDELCARTYRISPNALPLHKLEKADLENILQEADVTLVPPMSEQFLQQAFVETSAVGRGWRRDVVGRRLHVDTVEELINVIESAERSILLSGIPGSGKTCVLLELQEALEQRDDLASLFVQTREYAECLNPEARKAQGLPEDLLGVVARMAERKPVVVILDSLDVLSLSREHQVLKFFLSLIDRWLLIPKVTVVAACRDFDRKYDRNLAVRSWGCVVHTQPLNWDGTVSPLLRDFGLDPEALDRTTRSLLQNPRELTMFTDIASRVGVFNIATSQTLSRQYLQTVVLDEPLLGDTAMAAIEAMAGNMLKSRRLDIPKIQTGLSSDMLRRLLSANILHENQSGNIEFGHQTLLDVLVVGGAQRDGLTLKQFIEQLPPVPFVRPAIRAFIAYLAAGDRASLRKQLRAVFESDIAFHIRRLAAESLAEQIPQGEDWPLIRQLYQHHREVFQPLYLQAVSLEWHRFWLQFLLPYLFQKRDAQGLFAHVRRIGLWKKADPDSVVQFWNQVLQQHWLDRDQIAWNLAIELHDFDFAVPSDASKLVETLLSFPRRDHHFLGRALARCVDAGKASDDLLWRYISGDIGHDDILQFHFGNKLHCAAHEFGDQDFLRKRMSQSERLLDLAIDSVERWSIVKNKKTVYREWGERFLNFTSYEHIHSRHDTRRVSAENVLFGAIENAILQHAEMHSAWWLAHRHALCGSPEAALRYTAILALIKATERNSIEIGNLVADPEMLASSLSYELGNLIHASFVYLDTPIQDAVESAILNLWGDRNLAENPWIQGARLELLTAIPVHLRSPQSEIAIRDWETAFGPCIRKPHIGSWSGGVSAPFSYERFFEFSDALVLRLLNHYVTDTGRNWEDDFLVDGAEQVEWQLREAASRSPDRFIRFLAEYWADIPEHFTDDILDGVATYLAHRYGNLHFDPNQWQPVEEPIPQQLAGLILDEIERHPSCWRHCRAAAKALEACANVIDNGNDADRLLFAAIGFIDVPESTSDDDRDLINKGINMIRGKVAEALMIVATHWAEKRLPLPELLIPTLRRFANDPHSAIRALILRRLPYLHPELGWALFDLATADNDDRLWKIAEPYLYYAYHKHFDKVSPVLQRIVSTANGEALETWGRISALANFPGHVDFEELVSRLQSLNSVDAWKGAATVWTHHENLAHHSKLCLAGIRLGLEQENEISVCIATEMSSLFRKDGPTIPIPFDLIDRYFSIIENNQGDQRFDLYDFDAWLNALSQANPDEALEIAERFAAYVHSANYPLYDLDDVTQLLTNLFREAEEREEADDGALLNRVVALQDAFLSTGFNALQDWLRDAERS